MFIVCYVAETLAIYLVAFRLLLLGGERHCESRVPCPKTQRNDTACAPTRTFRPGVLRAKTIRPPVIIVLDILLLLSDLVLSSLPARHRYKLISSMSGIMRHWTLCTTVHNLRFENHTLPVTLTVLTVPVFFALKFDR